MNTKAATAATNAPTAKNDAIALAEKAAKMTAEDRKALALRVLEGDADEEDQKLFEALKTENMKATAARKVHLETISAAVQALAGTSRPFGPDDMLKLFGTQLISEVAHGMGIVKDTSQTGVATTADGTKKKREKISYPSDNAPVIFHFPSLGKPGDQELNYHVGRIYENYKNNPAGKFPFGTTKDAAPAKLKKHGTSIAGLMAFLPVDAEQRKAAIEHLKKDTGASEIAALMQHLNGNEMKTEQAAKEIKAELDKLEKATEKKAA